MECCVMFDWNAYAYWVYTHKTATGREPPSAYYPKIANNFRGQNDSRALTVQLFMHWILKKIGSWRNVGSSLKLCDKNHGTKSLMVRTTRVDYHHEARIQLVRCRVDIDILDTSYRKQTIVSISKMCRRPVSTCIRPLRRSANGFLKASKQVIQ